MIDIAKLVMMAFAATACAGAPQPGPQPQAPATPPGGSKSGPSQAAGPTGTLNVSAVGFRNNKGQVLIAVFASEHGFPDRGRFAAKRVIAKIEQGRVRVRFDDLPAGDYAVSILHDENGNFEMDTGLFGIPKEGYGASNNAKGRFGPPSWEDARFVVAPDSTVTQEIRIIYP